VTETAAALRLVYGPNAAKKIARQFGIAVVTAKLWLSGRTPAARHYEIARELIEEAIRAEHLIVETRRRLERELNGLASACGALGSDEIDPLGAEAGRMGSRSAAKESGGVVDLGAGI
jgi:hypothetical protein